MGNSTETPGNELRPVGSAGDDDAPVVRVREIHKHFAGVHALKGADLDIRPGTVHALVGENGAGKSTLGKIIAGAIRPDSGSLEVNGSEAQYHSPRDALADGVVLIAQELELVPELTVEANVLLGAEPRVAGFISRRALRSRFEELIVRSGFELRADATVGELRVAEQQQVEILRAIARNARVIVMDEPTAALTLDEVEKLHAIVRSLREARTTIIYVSHFLEEVLSLADAVSVLRNGELIRTSAARDETVSSLVTAMLGREMTLRFPTKAFPRPTSPVVLSVRGLSSKNVLHDVSLNLRAGEIVGLAGLLGSGRSELTRALSGADPTDSGVVELSGEELNLRTPRRAFDAGIALVPEDRKEQGLVMELSVAQNMTLPHLRSLTLGGFVNAREESRITSSAISQLDIVTRSPRAIVNTLSGGNQQKTLFGKCLLREPKVLLLDEPTRGVDVGAKLRIYEFIHALAQRGIAILLVSSELEEIMGLAHRILVMRLGRLVAEFENRDLSMDQVMRAAFGFAAEDLTEGTVA